MQAHISSASTNGEISIMAHKYQDSSRLCFDQTEASPAKGDAFEHDASSPLAALPVPPPVKNDKKETHATDLSYKNERRVMFSDDADVIVIPSIDKSLLKELFYQESETSLFRCESHMEAAGMDPDNFDWRSMR
jgi:hypothetical protein